MFQQVNLSSISYQYSQKERVHKGRTILFHGLLYMTSAAQEILMTGNSGQQNLTFFLAHEEKYLSLIELLTLNSNV